MDTLKVYNGYFKKKYNVLAGVTSYFKEKGNTIALWGAGKKGAAFLEVTDPCMELISYVFDRDISKAGSYMPSGHIIENYMEKHADVVLIANSNFEFEIIHMVHKVNPGAKLINIDNIILGGLTVEDVITPAVYNITKVRDCKICAVVILFNPGPGVTENIKSYLDGIDLLYIYDNSPDNKTDLPGLRNCNKVVYIKKEENMGLPYAFNEVAELASKEGFDWMFTFDQDSMACNGMVQSMREFVESSICKPDTAVVAPVTYEPGDEKEVQDIYITYLYKVIQSGAMHNLKIMKEIGNYDENMFIDEVDFEYCARCIINGYKIIKINKALLIHNKNDTDVSKKYTDGVTVSINKFSPDRYYYRYRNALYCYEKYKESNPVYALDCLNTIKVMELNLKYNGNFEENSKAIKHAVDDYHNGVMGKRKQL